MERIPKLEAEIDNLKQGQKETRDLIKAETERIAEAMQWDRLERSRQHAENRQQIEDLQKYRYHQEGGLGALGKAGHAILLTLGAIIGAIGHMLSNYLWVKN